MGRPVAIFDLDSTLLEGDCEQMWCSFMARKHKVDADFLKTIQKYYADYELGCLDYVEYEKFLLYPLTQCTADEVNGLVDEYVSEVLPLFRPNIVQRLEDHRARGNVLLLASASNNLLLQPIAHYLHIPNLICTWVEMQGGVPTGELAGEAPFREAKARLIQAWVTENRLSLQESWGYSDSHNDLPFLNLVEHPVAVTPDAILRQYALSRGWPILEKIV